jgi:hypothetical protein
VEFVEILLKLTDLLSAQRISSLNAQNKSMALRNELQFNRQVLELLDLEKLDELDDFAAFGQIFRSEVYQELLRSGYDFGDLPRVVVKVGAKNRYSSMSERLSSVYTRLEVLRVYFVLRSRGDSSGLKAVRAKLRLENLTNDLDRITLALKGAKKKGD